MARDAFDDAIKNYGITTTRLKLYTSKESHYSFLKNAAFMGIGKNSVRLIDVNEKGIMIPEALESQIQKDLSNGFAPFFVNATAGTTVLGAFDPISTIGDICKKYGLWLHVDGAYCGGVIFSEKYKKTRHRGGNCGFLFF